MLSKPRNTPVVIDQKIDGHQAGELFGRRGTAQIHPDHTPRAKVIGVDVPHASDRGGLSVGAGFDVFAELRVTSGEGARTGITGQGAQLEHQRLDSLGENSQVIGKSTDLAALLYFLKSGKSDGSQEADDHDNDHDRDQGKRVMGSLVHGSHLKAVSPSRATLMGVVCVNER